MQYGAECHVRSKCPDTIEEEVLKKRNSMAERSGAIPRRLSPEQSLSPMYLSILLLALRFVIAHCKSVKLHRHGQRK